MSSPNAPRYSCAPRSSPRPRCSILAVLFSGMSAMGCGGGHDDLVRNLDEMRGEIKELRASVAASQDRLDALERTGASPSPGAQVDAPDRPSLEVVRLVPEEPAADFPSIQYEQEAAAVSNGPRPVVQANRYGSTITQTEARR